MKVDGGGGVGVAGKVVGSYDGVDDGVGVAASGETWDGRTLVNESGGVNVGEVPPELLREVVGLVSSVSRSA